MYASLKETINQLKFVEIAADRRELLDNLSQHIQKGLEGSLPASLNFICTHNSRRSQLAQIWGQTAADLYEIPVSCFSGGVEVTAFNERAVEAIRRAGFQVTVSPGDNPIYTVTHSEGSRPITAFSKLYDDSVNPDAHFVAVMTCSEADENCPFIPGADLRIPLRYEDPKASDGTPQEAAKYDERSNQIGAEMLYLFSRVK